MAMATMSALSTQDMGMIVHSSANVVAKAFLFAI